MKIIEPTTKEPLKCDHCNKPVYVGNPDRCRCTIWDVGKKPEPYKLRTYQQEAANTGVWHLKNYGKPFILVLATGAGKSLVIAEICHQIDEPILILQPSKEILEQNYAKLQSYGITDISVYSASMNSKEISKFTYATIGSIYKKPELFSHFKYVIIDECHQVNPKNLNAMYTTFLNAIGCKNVCGLTATPYRLQQKYSRENGSLVYTAHLKMINRIGYPTFWKDIAYKIETADLIKQGYLCPILYRQDHEADMQQLEVNSTGADFTTESLERFWNDKRLRKMAAVIKKIDANCQRNLIFMPSVRAGERAQALLGALDVYSTTVTSKTSQIDREYAIKQFKEGKIRHLINVGVFTTGFDVPAIDCVTIARPTMSLNLYCLDKETEILTSHGWKGMGQIKIGDCVPSMNMDTGKGEWTEVTGSVTRNMQPFEKWIEYSAPRANFRVTNKHRMITSYKRSDSRWSDYSLKEAESMGRCVRMPTAVAIDQPGIPLTDAELYFIGIMMTDGYWSPVHAVISQSERHPEILKRIEKCLNSCGLAWTKREVKIYESDTYKAVNKRWRYYINAGKPRRGVKGSGFRHLMPYLDKDFSPALMAMSKRQFEVLVKAMWDGDGFKKLNVDYQPRSWTICSARKLAVERVQALAAINGMTANLRWEHANRKNPIAILTITPQDWRSVSGYDSRPQIETKPATKEKVWCIETGLGTIITRRQGKVTVMGNCQMVGRGVRIDPLRPDKVLRVYDLAGVVKKLGRVETIRVVKEDPPNQWKDRVVSERGEMTEKALFTFLVKKNPFKGKEEKDAVEER